MSDVDSSFDGLYRREVRSLAMVATALTGSAEVGAELAHEALLRAFKSWPAVSQLERPGAWLRRVVINLAIDAGRRSRRERRAMARVRHAAAVDPGDPGGERFWSEVRELPSRQRLAVVLRYVGDRSIADIAEIMSVSDGMVKAALFAARKSLSASLAIEEVFDDDLR